jgi:hypothetical protein
MQSLFFFFFWNSFKSLAPYSPEKMLYINGIFVIGYSYYTNTSLQIPAYSYHHREPKILPSTCIHPDSAADQLGLTPAELTPILHEQQEFLPDKLTHSVAMFLSWFFIACEIKYIKPPKYWLDRAPQKPGGYLLGHLLSNQLINKNGQPFGKFQASWWCTMIISRLAACIWVNIFLFERYVSGIYSRPLYVLLD